MDGLVLIRGGSQWRFIFLVKYLEILNPNFGGLKMGTRGHGSSLDLQKISREREKFGNMCLVILGIVCVGETSVWCYAVDCSWGCVLAFTGS